MVSCGSGSAVGSACALSLVEGSGAGDAGLSLLALVAQPLVANKANRAKTKDEILSCLMA